MGHDRKALAALFLTSAFGLPTYAGSIDTLSSWTGASAHSFGDVAGENAGGTTFGETFIIREANAALTVLSFGVTGYAPTAVPEACTFEAVIMAWNGSRPTGPVLYQSSPITMPLSGFFPSVVFNLDLGGVKVKKEDSYVVFFTSNHFLNGVRSDAAMYVVGDIYADGSFVSHRGPDFNSLTTQNWGVYPWFADLAIRLDYVTVPESGTLALFGIGLAGLSLSRRRKAS